MNKKRILVVLVDRANYGRMKPVMSELKSRDSVDLQVLCAGTMLLERFGKVAEIVENDGFNVTSKVYMEVEGSNPTTMSKSIGLGIIDFSNEFHKINPDIVLLIGDRYEAHAATVAAAYMNLVVAHIQGGEVSGSIDESCRHAISKLSHIHFPSTKRSADYLIRMGEEKKYVHNFGCPVGDYILSLPDDLKNKDISGGIGASIDFEQKFILVIFHPVTTNFISRDQIQNVLEVLHKKKTQVIWLWPNIDAGADVISTTIRSFREKNDTSWLYLIKNFKPETFQKILKKACCAIGNSSSFIRDTTFSGTPVVLVGNRQVGREHGENLIESSFNKDDLDKNINHQINHGRYEGINLYGEGNSSAKIVNELLKPNPKIQKTISYIKDEKSS